MYLYGGEIHVQTLPNEFDTRTQALFWGMFSFGLAARSRLTPFRVPRVHPEPQGEYLLKREVQIGEWREMLNFLNGKPSKETLEMVEGRKVEIRSRLEEARIRHPESEWLFKLTDVLEAWR